MSNDRQGPAAAGFCRDCFERQYSRATRCRHCGSPRLVSHAELGRLAIAHIDCDAFYASIEKRDRPELRDRPLIIGGGHRGVVSTACYLARISGVHSAMPMFKALAACPNAVVLRPDMEKYARVGAEMRELMRALTPLVEPVSIDEAFLDLSGTERLHGESPAMVLARFAQAVEKEIGITVSIGLSYCKFLAKLASDLRKPRGFAVIGRTEAVQFLAGLPVSAIWGVGRSLEATLRGHGIRSIAQLQNMERDELLRRYGVMGARLHALARGIDERRVEAQSVAKSVSAETTFAEDLATLDELVPHLRRLSEKVSARLKAGQIAGRTLVLKLKSRDFRVRTRNRSLPDPTRLADRIFTHGLELLRKEVDGTQFRLLGIGVSDLSAADRADPRDLLDFNAGKRAAAEAAMDRLRARFGEGSVETGHTFGKK